MTIDANSDLFKHALRTKDFVVTAELPLTPESNAQTVLEDVQLLNDSVDGFVFTDNQYGQPHMNPLAAAAIVRQHGFPPIMQLSCRNRNRIALLGDLFGARALGVDSVMLVRAGKLPEGYWPRAKAVNDVNTRELIETTKRINDDEKLGSAKNFLIGTSATIHEPTGDWHPEELLAKLDAGAQFMFTQLCFDAGMIRRYVEFLVGKKLLQRFSLIVSTAILPSADLAIWLRENHRQSVIPASVINRLRHASDPAQESVHICTELLREVAAIPGIAGVNFYAGGDLAVIPDIVRDAGIAT